MKDRRMGMGLCGITSDVYTPLIFIRKSQRSVKGKLFRITGRSTFPPSPMAMSSG